MFTEDENDENVEEIWELQRNSAQHSQHIIQCVLERSRKKSQLGKHLRKFHSKKLSFWCRYRYGENYYPQVLSCSFAVVGLRLLRESEKSQKLSMSTVDLLPRFSFFSRLSSMKLKVLLCHIVHHSPFNSSLLSWQFMFYEFHWNRQWMARQTCLLFHEKFSTFLFPKKKSFQMKNFLEKIEKNWFYLWVEKNRRFFLRWKIS